MRNYKWLGCVEAAIRCSSASTYCFDIWQAAIDRSYNARQLLLIPNSSFLILPAKFPIYQD